MTETIDFIALSAHGALKGWAPHVPGGPGILALVGNISFHLSCLKGHISCLKIDVYVTLS